MAVVLITGCTSGIGERAALALARAGADVAAACRDPARAAPLLDTARAEGLSLEAVALDVQDEASVAAGVAAAVERFGPLDVVVNNAGLHLIAPAEMASIEQSSRILDTNVLGALRVMQAVLPAMRERGRGRVINVTSGAAFIAVPHMAMYAASKHAIDALSAAMANELKPFGVTIATVAPGCFHTAIMDKGILARETFGYSDYAATQCQQHIDDVANAPDPEPVADAIVRVALGADEPPLRTLVGEDVGVLAPEAEMKDGYQEWFAPA